MGAKKLLVEIASAANLMPKDGQGSASPYCVVEFDGQRQQTEVREKDLNPVWNSVVEFSALDSPSMEAQALVVTVLSVKKPSQRRPSFLGRVRIRGANFAKQGEEALVYYQLKRRSLFSQVKGEIGLKVWWTDEPDPPPPAEAPAEAAAEAPAGPAEAEAPPAEPPAPEIEAATPESAEAVAPGSAGGAASEPGAPPAEPSPEAAPEPEANREDERIEVIEKTMMSLLEPVYWDHNLPYACEVPWNNFIAASVLENPYINLPEESWIIEAAKT